VTLLCLGDAPNVEEEMTLLTDIEGIL